MFGDLLLALSRVLMGVLAQTSLPAARLSMAMAAVSIQKLVSYIHTNITFHECCCFVLLLFIVLLVVGFGRQIGNKSYSLCRRCAAQTWPTAVRQGIAVTW